MTLVVTTELKSYTESAWTDNDKMYYLVEVEGLDDANDVVALSQLRVALEDYAAREATVENKTIIAQLQYIAAEIAEDLEIPFIYSHAGVTREYTPAAAWEASGGCEWEESAQEGYDYGWDI
jgi:hypothetical protein